MSPPTTPPSSGPAGSSFTSPHPAELGVLAQVERQLLAFLFVHGPALQSAITESRTLNMGDAAVHHLRAFQTRLWAFEGPLGWSLSPSVRALMALGGRVQQSPEGVVRHG